MYRSDPSAIALEMSGSWLSFAFLRKGKIVGEFHKKVGVRHDEIFWREFPKRLARSGLKLSDLDFIATTRGPGRFTGVRLGLAIANVWVRVLKIPLFAPTAIDLLKWQSHGEGASFLIGFSGAYSGSVGGCSIKGYVRLDDFLKEHKKKSPDAKIFYWAEDAKFQEIQEAMKRDGLTSFARPVVPKAEDLLEMAVSNKNPAFFRKNPAYPIYLKETWQ